jgi:hypothetical protein
VQLTPFFFHRYVGAGMPLAATVKVTGEVAFTVWAEG